MILNTLKLGNFRVYRGDHEIDLRPEGPSGAKPIILFGGLNGAGKTSILTAVRLTLYGQRILGAKVPTEEYQQYLSDCIHKPTGSERIPNSAEVQLNNRDGRGGGKNEYDVVRS
jgi:DNA sulfur modification protein DndD